MGNYMGLQQLNFEGYNKVEVAIMRLQQFEPPEGYYLAFAGGKDRMVIYDLALVSGVKVDAHYHSEPDPPELVQFIRRNYPDVIIEKNGFNFWGLIVKKGFPLRKKRWCCEYFKEWGGANRLVVTGVRWAESPGRRKHKLVDVGVKTRFCAAPKAVLHPIIDWSTGEVWEYIRQNNLPYCSLYDEGFKRLGCVMCPMTSNQNRQREALRFPKIALAWEHAFERLYEAKKDKYGMRWKSGKDMFNWWMGLPDGTNEDAPCRLFG